jgi:hypothetical protein
MKHLLHILKVGTTYEAPPGVIAENRALGEGGHCERSEAIQI